MQRLQSHGVRAGIVQNIADLTEHDTHMRSRDFFAPVPHAILGDVPVSGLPWQMSVTPGGYPCGGPCLGEHNDYVYRDLLGLTDVEIDAYTAEGILT